VVALAAVIFGLVMVRLASTDTTRLMSGPPSVLVVVSLACDVVACCLVFAGESRRRAFLRRYGEIFMTGPVADA
jgi:hypothetical protein